MSFTNIIDYVKKADSRLNLRNFADADALVFSQLAYLDFSCFKSGTPFLKMGGKAQESAAKSHSFVQNEELLRAISLSPRFRIVKVAKHVSETNLLFEMQFSATTFLVSRGLIVVSFRGTDNTINGWKEDFNMVFIDEIPAQSKAAAYLKRVASKYPLHKIIVTGHSKGGNLAIYAAMKQTKSTKKKIVSVYSLDGPEFRKQIASSKAYLEIIPKVKKIVPEESIIGMILQINSFYYIVKSDGSLFAQHNLYNWHVDDENGELIHLEQLSKTSRRIKNSLYAWLNGFSVSDRQIIIDNFFDMMLASECETLSDFLENWKKHVKVIYGEYRESDNYTKKLLRRAFIDLAKNLLANSFASEKKIKSVSTLNSREEPEKK
ncbi:MAG: Mbeg1-like protein [Bacilli bacterium]|jgi:hypothetical protein